MPRLALDMRRQFPCLQAALTLRLVTECALSLDETTQHPSASTLVITKIPRNVGDIAS